MDKDSPKFKTQQRIARISLLASVVLVGLVVWGNYQRNLVGDKTLSFDKTPMPEAFAKIEEIYLSEIILEDADLAECFITAIFTDKTLDEVLTSMSQRYHFDLERKGPRTFSISGGRCRNF